jgi:hypothetical protein
MTSTKEIIGSNFLAEVDGKNWNEFKYSFFFFIVYLTRSKERNLDLTWWPIKSIRNAAYLHFLHFNVVHVISNKTLSFWFWCIVESISWYFDYDIWKFDSFKSQGLNKNKTFVSWILTSSRMVEWSTKKPEKTFFYKKKNHSVFIFSISVSMNFFFFLPNTNGWENENECEWLQFHF